MKSILLIRHAKSSWDDLSMADIDRPLNDRGKRDAPMMADRLGDKGVEIDAFISSPAKRARKTAEIFSKALGHGKKDVDLKDELYEASDSDFASVVASLSNNLNTVAIFSHNPGITDYANSLTPTHIDNIPTTGIFAVHAETNDWKNFSSASKEVWFFDYPKNLID
jgi:phosphohistidine phosphatase